MEKYRVAQAQCVYGWLFAALRESRQRNKQREPGRESHAERATQRERHIHAEKDRQRERHAHTMAEGNRERGSERTSEKERNRVCVCVRACCRNKKKSEMKNEK